MAVRLDGRSGVIRVPRLTAAIAGKASASRLDGRRDGRDLADAAMLLSLVDDPAAAKAALSASEHRRLALITGLLEPEHAAWAMLPPLDGARGRAALAALAARTGRPGAETPCRPAGWPP